MYYLKSGSQKALGTNTIQMTLYLCPGLTEGRHESLPGNERHLDPAARHVCVGPELGEDKVHVSSLPLQSPIMCAILLIS